MDIPDYAYLIFIYCTVGLALLWALVNTMGVLSIKLQGSSANKELLVGMEKIEMVLKVGDRI